MADKKKKKSSDSSSISVVPGAFITLLKRVRLGGVLESCVIETTKKGIARVQAVDITNSLFLSISIASFENMKEEGVFGIGNIELLEKFFSSVEDEETVSMEVDDNRLVFKRKGHGRLNYLLTEPDLIPTKEDYNEESVSKLLKQCEFGLDLSKKACDDFSSYMNMVKTKEAKLVFKKGKVKLEGGSINEHQFSVELGKANPLKKKADEDSSFEIPVIGDQLVKVLSAIDFKKEEPTISFSENNPVVIKIDDENVWALVPISEEQ